MSRSTGQKRLKNAKVLCVGAGGLGSPALMYLAAAGVGTLGIVDFDTVDESNLQRQIIHGQSDIGRPKAESAARLGAGDQPVRERGHPQHRAGQRQRLRDLRPVRPDRRRHRQLRHPLHGQRRLRAAEQAVRVGVDLPLRRPGSVFWAEHGPCYRCLYPEPPPPGMVPSCAEGGVLGVLCASVGSIQVTEAIKVITGIGEPLVGGLMVYDALEMTYRKIKVRKDPNCAVCGENPTVTELIDYDDFCGAVSDEASDGRGRLHHHRERAQRLAQRGQADLPGRRAGAGRVRDRQDPRLGADPQGRDHVRRRRSPALPQDRRSSCTARPACAAPRLWPQ